MNLYHGTNTDIIEIDLSKGNKYKDFGQGFYLTSDRATAVRMATKKARLFGGQPTLITYEFDESALDSDLKIKCFPAKATAEWLKFVAANRDKDCPDKPHNYDIISGPIADDGVVLTLTNFQDGIYTPEQAAIALQDKYLDQQYYFGSKAALTFITKIKVELV